MELVDVFDSYFSDSNIVRVQVGNPGTYVNLTREWKNGDVISFDLPMDFKATR